MIELRPWKSHSEEGYVCIQSSSVQLTHQHLKTIGTRPSALEAGANGSLCAAITPSQKKKQGEVGPTSDVVMRFWCGRMTDGGGAAAVPAGANSYRGFIHPARRSRGRNRPAGFLELRRSNKEPSHRALHPSILPTHSSYSSRLFVRQQIDKYNLIHRLA
ncbi:hypothetical protein PGTUg99_034487 [Puccinia graminis f. sp. tritici]|uniref:Uncharacterized protein n=1 Tax=Puccinia graminis f. sp. tritici TaxID=56615 RepID=A0A5B0RV05_PUCGR|nr:hypothetical protein PGTUg99_034487 [Puccinia graminis f. sp. tritici]